MFLTENRVKEIIGEVSDIKSTKDINFINEITARVNSNVEREICRLLSLNHEETLTKMIKARFSSEALSAIKERVDAGYNNVEKIVETRVNEGCEIGISTLKAATKKQIEEIDTSIDEVIDRVLASPLLIEKLVERINKNQISKT